MIVRRNGRSFAPPASRAMELLLAVDAVRCEGNSHQTLDRNCTGAFQAPAVLTRIKKCERFIEVPEFLFRPRDQSRVSFDLLGRARRIDLGR